MATIFPGSASVGQIFNGYTFDGTVWNINGIDLTENYLEESSASAIYLNKVSASSTYLTQVNASSTYAPIVPAVQTGFRNAIINGDFGINQRGFTSLTTNGAYGFDRWLTHASSGGTYSAQTFTPGAAPVSGYEGKNFYRIVTAGQSGADVYTSFEQRIEDVRTFAGQTVTVSFWAKAASGTPKVSIEFIQNFGTGGSSTVLTNASTVTLSTSWARYSVSVAIPSISGKTIGTSSYLSSPLFWVSAGTTFASRANSIGIQSNTFDFWGVQVEAGSTATPFEQRPIGIELELCQRYYINRKSDFAVINGFTTANAQKWFSVSLPTTMRAAPNFTPFDGAGNSGRCTTIDGAGTGTNNVTPSYQTSYPTLVSVLFTGTNTGLSFGYIAEIEL